MADGSTRRGILFISLDIRVLTGCSVCGEFPEHRAGTTFPMHLTVLQDGGLRWDISGLRRRWMAVCFYRQCLLEYTQS